MLQISLYHGHDNEEDTGEQAITLPHVPQPADRIIDVLNYQIGSTHQGGFQKFLVRWQNRTISNATWIIATDFQRPNPDLYERYRAIIQRVLPSRGELMQYGSPKELMGPHKDSTIQASPLGSAHKPNWLRSYCRMLFLC